MYLFIHLFASIFENALLYFLFFSFYSLRAFLSKLKKAVYRGEGKYSDSGYTERKTCEADGFSESQKPRLFLRAGALKPLKLFLP